MTRYDRHNTKLCPIRVYTIYEVNRSSATVYAHKPRRRPLPRTSSGRPDIRSPPSRSPSAIHPRSTIHPSPGPPLSQVTFSPNATP
ncbi:hypothetical protein FA13DRAFT_1732261 [Coprinellus micaceus]|uniref:Uncharacterized protein n=1 Tax=Coprinellus micaceus TaxID=71717 RepID=A0A4Y7TCX1_COPMI|nr:hypothetical protein FA13DRAFT_1732261 [Coprinellus micaceus]